MAGEEERREVAEERFRQAYQHQMRGEYEQAIPLYEQSIELFPTAEAHTFLGWTYSFMGRLDEAIAECHKAIEVDPDFGNPYNDIGAYLMQRGQLDEAIPWLLRAMKAPRYENPHFPYMNLARVWERKGRWADAAAEYRRALEIQPNDQDLMRALQGVLSKGNGKRFTGSP